MKPEDIRTSTLEELAVIEGDLRRQLWKARFDNRPRENHSHRAPRGSGEQGVIGHDC
jgi:ribosomal protein L29